MNMSQRVLSPFLGGLIGILLSGYAYYVTGQHHSWLLPVGVLTGSSLGYFFGDVKGFLASFSKKRRTWYQVFTTYFQKLKLSYDRSLRAMKSRLVKLKFKFSKSFTKTIAFIACTPQKLKVFVVKAFKNLGGWSSHPVNKSLIVRSALTVLVFGSVIYLYFSFVGIDYSSANEDNILLGLLGVGNAFLFIGSMAFSVAIVPMNFAKVYDSQSSFFAEYEKVSQNRLKVIVKGLFNNIKIFAYFLLLVSIFYSGFVLGMFYVMLFIMPIMALCAILIAPFLWYLNALKKFSVLTTFITTLAVTTTAYVLFNGWFSNQVIIWFVALCTGSTSALVSKSLYDYMKTKEKMDIGSLLTSLGDFLLLRVAKVVYTFLKPIFEYKFII